MSSYTAAMRRTLRAALVVAVIGVVSTGVSAAEAQAVTPANVYTESDAAGAGPWNMLFRAAAGTRNTPVFTRSGDTLIVDDRVPLKAGAGCAAVKGDNTKVRCTRPRWGYVVASLGDGNDTLTNKITLQFWADGNEGDDVMYGSSGQDVVNAGPGNDTIYGGAGNDSLAGNEGVDHIYGGTGDDGLAGWEGTDYLHGQDGDDYLIGQSGVDYLYGEAGDDNLDGGSGNDYFYGGEGSDLLRSRPYTGVDADYFSGGNGTDTLTYQEYTAPITADADGVKGDDGASGEHDTIAVDVNVIIGGSGDDRLSGAYGRQMQLLGGPGDDALRITGTNTGKSTANVLNGGANRTYAGDLCATVAPKVDKLIDCDR